MLSPVLLMCVIIADDLNTVLDISVIETQYPPLCS